jgi:general secretion pathway protein A
MYTNYFKMSEPPFSLTPDPRYLFMSERHREGLAHLLYGIQQLGGFVQLTGEIGSGKTTLCRCLIKQLPPETDVALILNPRLTAIELLATVCDELRIPYPVETDSIKILIDALNQRLLETHARGRRTVLIIDEAQNLHAEVLEQIRLLTNLETSQEKLLQIILIGQPELLSLLMGEKLRQLAQRITARYHLLPLSLRETYAYVQHRLLVAGGSDSLFTGQAMRCVYRLSGGVPRIINIICDRSLLGAYALDKRRVSARIVRRASREIRGFVPLNRRLRLAWTIGIVLLAALTVGGAIVLSTTNRSAFRRGAPAVNLMTRSPSDKPLSTAPMPAAKPTVGDTPGYGRSAPLKMDHPLARVDMGANRSYPEPGPAVKVPKAPDVIRQPGHDNSSAKVSSGPRLLDLLTDPSVRSDGVSSFASLYALWGTKFHLNPSELGCKAVRAQGFECLFQEGSWPKLRRFDMPAILDMMLPSGVRHRVALVGLGDETATLAIGGRQYTFPLSEIDRIWDGSFILLWKPPFASRQISQGARGEEVVWLRQALDRLEGKAPNPAVSDLYDENLRHGVMAFQRERSLTPDGYVGIETLARLVLALEGPNAPSISRHAR